MQIWRNVTLLFLYYQSQSFFRNNISVINKLYGEMFICHVPNIADFI